MAFQRGALQFLPPEILGGHLGLEADVRHMSDTERMALGQWVGLYKQLRNRLHTGQVWLGEAGDGVLWQAHDDAGASEVLLLMYRTTPTTHRNTRGIAPERRQLAELPVGPDSMVEVYTPTPII